MVEEHLSRQEIVIVPSKSISDQIYEILKERILLGKIAPGERMIESTIAGLCQTSSTPVREAFQRLVQDLGWWSVSPKEASALQSSLPK